MDVLGHDDIDHAELYSREASQVRLAVQGMDRVVRLVTRKPLVGEPTGEPRGEPPRKTLINNDNGGPGGCLENEGNQIVGDQWDRTAFKSVPMFFNVSVPPFNRVARAIATCCRHFPCEPPRICRRPYGLSYAAMAGSSSVA
jgi:hypothetical protein